MTQLGGILALCALLAVGRGGPLNATAGERAGKHGGPCSYEMMYCVKSGGSHCPQCDDDGYFRPKQCSPARGSCWCVDTETGEEVPHMETWDGDTLDCGPKKPCPEKFHHYDGRCFMFVSAPKTWSEGEKFCQVHHSNLASVHTYEEYHYLQLMTVGDTEELLEAWLGAHDLVQPGFWVWCDGSKFYNEYWCHKEEADKSGCCLRMNYGFDKKWGAGNCSEPLPFFCSKMADSYYTMKEKDHM